MPLCSFSICGVHSSMKSKFSAFVFLLPERFFTLNCIALEDLCNLCIFYLVCDYKMARLLHREAPPMWGITGTLVKGNGLCKDVQDTRGGEGELTGVDLP